MELINGERLSLGVCYYPEHWPTSNWESDLLKMLNSGIETVRIAEFAWNKIEPREGEFDYSFFDRFLQIAEKTGMQVIFCTPTATPPAWLTEKYNEVLNANIDGVLYRHGARRHYNYNSPKYQELSQRIVEHSASHYGSHTSIVGWQIDNELNCGVDLFYSESDTMAFREFLKSKYQSLDSLNEAWGTVFWNQTYTNWKEIYVPRTTVSNSTNPHEVLDYYRFISDSVCRFAKMQSDIIRKHIKPGDFVTTNGIFDNLDSHRMTDESLSFMTFDSYPNFAYCRDMYNPKDEIKDRKWSRNLTQVRSISKRFGIMEQQSGANGWNTQMIAPTPKPGQITLWTMQSIAHGAEYISYFRWRSCTFGTEIYWHGILDYSGRDNWRLEEIKKIHSMLGKLQEISGSSYFAKIAILQDYDNIWDSQLDIWHSSVDSVSQKALFNALQKTHTPFDYCYLDHSSLEDLQKYDLLFYPHAVIMNQERADLLSAYVNSGGYLIFGCRSAYKDISGKCVTFNLPGLISKLTGTDIPEYSLISPEDEIVNARWGDDIIETAVFNDLLRPLENADAVATYSDNYYAGEPAIIKNKSGSGETYYFGGAFTEQSVKVFLKKLKIISPYSSIIMIPECCELAVREKNNDKYLFVLNYEKEPQSIELKCCAMDLISESTVKGKLYVKPYECKVYKIDR